MPKGSMYTERYLRENGTRGEGKGLTPGSYLSYVLHGTAKTYAGRYARALLRDLNERVRTGEARRGDSMCKGLAYYPQGITTDPLGDQNHHPTPSDAS